MKSQAEADPWEALDVDDSELPRNRKYPPPHNPDSTLVRNPNPLEILRRCSSSRSSETLTRQPLLDPNPPPPESSYFRYLIPGPAAAVQIAMRRKEWKDPSSYGDQGDPIPTQEYIRRAVEEPDKEDEDFSRDPWISCVDYIRSEVAIGTPVSVIKSGFGTWDKVNQVVAIVKTCTPNGLGDLMMTLKDPTGTIDASVHRKVVAESEFGRDIRAGAVLILKKVAVCTPSRLSCFLNITLNNISKVIIRDTLPSVEQENPARSAKDPVPETEKCLKTVPKRFSFDQGKTDGIMNSLRRNAHASGETLKDVEMEDDNPAEEIISLKDVNKNQNEHGVEQVLMRNQDSNSKTETAAAHRTTGKFPQGKFLNPERRPQDGVAIDIDKDNWQELLVDELVRLEKHVGKSHQSHHSRPGYETGICDKYATDNKVDRMQLLPTSSVEKMQPVPATTSVPQWTDEQLDELFAFD
ncbi:PREDICTED: uncharacterized protein LOC104809628 isoform X2 [Tarenaya hassleriana]|uniref:uncharacterized protein LOC104809628 isoform X2 n=1 Tax=Tarenaya hassleriana TaxID=28532 RepID=UPI00053C1489|nr:PREDICTED: uncharacterized protein LOC104809628 isoform X2 [Tarenaya hassleriana]